jgi:hypothetical protein
MIWLNEDEARRGEEEKVREREREGESEKKKQRQKEKPRTWMLIPWGWTLAPMGPM